MLRMIMEQVKCTSDASLLKDLRASQELADSMLSKVLHSFKRWGKPLHLGTAACEAGISLERAELLAVELVKMSRLIQVAPREDLPHELVFKKT